MKKLLTQIEKLEHSLTLCHYAIMNYDDFGKEDRRAFELLEKLETLKTKIK